MNDWVSGPAVEYSVNFEYTVHSDPELDGSNWLEILGRNWLALPCG